SRNDLSIEQNRKLQTSSLLTSVVEANVAIDKYYVLVTGFANHAGTTPMAERQDALIAASQLAIAVRDVVTSEPGRQVGTVGHLEILPNAPNVIPGVARMTIEVRDLSPEKLRRLGDAIR